MTDVFRKIVETTYSDIGDCQTLGLALLDVFCDKAKLQSLINEIKKSEKSDYRKLVSFFVLLRTQFVKKESNLVKLSKNWKDYSKIVGAADLLKSTRETGFNQEKCTEKIVSFFESILADKTSGESTPDSLISEKTANEANITTMSDNDTSKSTEPKKLDDLSSKMDTLISSMSKLSTRVDDIDNNHAIWIKKKFF